MKELEKLCILQYIYPVGMGGMTALIVVSQSIKHCLSLALTFHLGVPYLAPNVH